MMEGVNPAREQTNNEVSLPLGLNCARLYPQWGKEARMLIFD
jgi:hypothetical protein